MQHTRSKVFAGISASTPTQVLVHAGLVEALRQSAHSVTARDMKPIGNRFLKKHQNFCNLITLCGSNVSGDLRHGDPRTTRETP